MSRSNPTVGGYTKFRRLPLATVEFCRDYVACFSSFKFENVIQYFKIRLTCMTRTVDPECIFSVFPLRLSKKINAGVVLEY